MGGLNRLHHHRRIPVKFLQAHLKGDQTYVQEGEGGQGRVHVHPRADPQGGQPLAWPRSYQHSALGGVD